MKKLIPFCVAAVISGMVYADGSIDVIDEEPLPDIEAVPEQQVRQHANWPVFFAFSEFPETPDVVGLRLTIPYSTVQESVSGFDIGLWGRCYDFEGFQLNILRNDVHDSLGGFQVGIYNTAGRCDLFGFQFGLWNQTTTVRGLQAGLVNVAEHAQGFQVGIVNRAETLYGMQIGFVNIIRDAELPVFPIVNIGF